MLKKFFVLALLLILTNCSMPGTAFLGPIFTGATTKSLSQTSLSFGTNRIVTNIHEASKKSKIKIQKLAKKVDNLGLKQSTKNIINFHK